MTRALIIGAAGQDGSYLGEQLVRDGVEVFGLTRAGLQIPGRPEPAPLTLEDRTAIRDLLRDGNFSEIYYLAAYHHSAEDLQAASDIMMRSFAVHVDGLINVLDAMAEGKSKTRLFYAASSHVFGVVQAGPQDEQTPMAPICAYGISKVAGVQLCRFYRENHGLHVSVGFLFNHESPRRPLRFLSRKVARAVAEIRLGRRSEVLLGDIEARVDWGYCPEYTDAMRRILALDRGGDFIIASGRDAAVRDFVEAAFSRAGLNWRDHVKIDPAMVQKIDRGPLVGDPSKLKQAIGWSARATLEDLAALMVDAELQAERRI